MFVADHQQARHDAVGAFEDQREFGRMQQALHGAIDHQVAALQGGHYRGELLQGIAGAGGTHGRGRGKRRGRHPDAHGRGAQRLHRQFRQLHIDASGLGLRYNPNHFLGGQGAQFKGAPKSRQPAVLDLLDKHRSPPGAICRGPGRVPGRWPWCASPPMPPAGRISFVLVILVAGANNI